MHLVIVTRVDINIPGAVVNRLLSYARGMVEIGHQVSMYWLGNTQDCLTNFRIQYPGIHFLGFAPIGFKNSRLLHPLTSLHTGFAARKLLKKENVNHPISAVLFYGILIPERIPIHSVCNKLGIKTFDDITEYPFLGRQTRIVRRLQYKIFMERYVLQDAGVLCISHGIMEFMKEHFSAMKCLIPVHLFGIIVEMDKFRCIEPFDTRKPLLGEYLAYCGSMYGDKDGVQDLIRAFSSVLDNYPDLKLVVIGDNSNLSKMKGIDNLVDSLKIRSKIVFTGRIEWALMHRYLCGAKALVLAKPSTKQNEGAFPTKLGEYLACSRPVITTEVGDIPLFLKDGMNAYLSQPDDPRKFAAKIVECLSDEQNNKEIAIQGNLLAAREFSHLVRAKQLKAIICDIKTDPVQHSNR